MHLKIENEYGNIDSAYGPAAKTYINWAATMALSLDTGVPCASKQMLLIPLSTPAVGSIVTISPQILTRNQKCGRRIGVDEYYLRIGRCKFGKACRYNHTRAKSAVLPILELNFLGLPIRMAPLYVSPERNMHPAPAYVMNNPAMESTVYAHNQPHIRADEFPDRPGQPKCSYFLKTGAVSLNPTANIII